MKETTYSVYMHRCPDGRVYIGSTSDIEHRFGRNGILYKKLYFWTGIQKYGWDNIEHIVLFENLTQKEAVAKETEMIERYNSTNPLYGFNVKKKGTASRHSEETRKKMSKTRKGKTPSDSHRKALSDARKGIKYSDETLRKMSESHIGYIMPQSQRDKISISCKGKGTKAVKMLSLDGEVLKRFVSIKEALAEVGGKSCGNISECCKGRKPHVYGYKWEYDLFTGQKAELCK